MIAQRSDDRDQTARPGQEIPHGGRGMGEANLGDLPIRQEFP